MNAEVAFAVTGNNFLLTVPGDPPLGLARWTSVMMGAKIPTLIEHLLEYVKQPAVKERLKPLEENLKPLEKALETVGACFYGISLNHVETPPSPGYEPWLVERGWNPIVARQMARLAVRHGKRVANDRARLPEVVRAIKFLARPDHHHQSVSRRVAVLLAAWNETSVIETIFLDAGLEEFEFTRLLQSHADGDRAAYPRLAEIAASLAPHLPNRRGRKISPASAAHEFFLDAVRELELRHAYTWNDLEQDFTDSLTETTRREFSYPQFDPRPAHRRSQAHKKTPLN